MAAVVVLKNQNLFFVFRVYFHFFYYRKMIRSFIIHRHGSAFLAGFYFFIQIFIIDVMKVCFPHTPAEITFFLPLVFTKMLLSARGMRKNSILTSGGPPVVSNILFHYIKHKYDLPFILLFEKSKLEYHNMPCFRNWSMV